MVIDGDGELLLRLFLANNVFIEEVLYFLRFRQLVGDGCGGSRGTVVFKNGIAYRDTLVADVCPGIVAWRRDQFGDSVLRLMAERTA
jgi:hypothetical protein